MLGGGGTARRGCRLARCIPVASSGLQCVSHVLQPLCGLVWMRFPGVDLSHIDPPLTEPDPRDPMLEEF